MRKCNIWKSALLLLYLGGLRGLFAAPTAFPDSLPNFSDEVHAKKYEITVSPRKRVEDVEDHDFRKINSKRGHGVEYTCYVPTKVAEQEESRSEIEEPSPPSVLLEPLQGICLAKTQDWWTYEVCRHGQVSQFHKQGEDAVQQFSLGKFSANLSDVDEILYELGPTAASSAYVRELYDGGSACDVKDIHRSTEVRYTCSEGGDTVITSIREVHSCSYQIVIATPLICKHRAFYGVQDPVHGIVCYPTTDPPAEAQAEGTVEDSKGMAGSDIAHLGHEAENLAPSEGFLPGDDINSRESPSVREDQAHSLDIDLDTLSEEAVDELVNSMMRQSSSGDPDIDFLGLVEEDSSMSGDENSPRDEWQVSVAELDSEAADSDDGNARRNDERQRPLHHNDDEL